MATAPAAFHAIACKAVNSTGEPVTQTKIARLIGESRAYYSHAVKAESMTTKKLETWVASFNALSPYPSIAMTYNQGNGWSGDFELPPEKDADAGAEFDELIADYPVPPGGE